MEKVDIQPFIQTFNFLMRFNCFLAIDAMFEKMIKEDWSQHSLDTNKILIVTFCRVNCKIRKELPHYEPFLQKSVQYLKNHNTDPISLLKGIL